MASSLGTFRLLAGLLVIAVWIAAAAPAYGSPSTGFRLGVINERTDKPDHALEQYGQLHAYLQSELAPKGVPVGELVIARDINEMANRVARGEVDAVIEGVMPTLSIQRRTGALDLALLTWRKGQRQYHSVFFARNDSAIASLDDLAGKTIAFEAPRSTSAYFVPRAALQAKGLTLSSAETAKKAAPDAVRYLFAGSELNQAYWVHRGRADVGAFNNGDWERVPEGIRRGLRIIHSTRPMLRWVFSFSAELDAQTRDRVSEVLLAAHLDDVGREALKAAAKIAKFEVLTDVDKDGLVYWEEVLSDLE